MEEITVKLDIPKELKEEFRSALAKALRNLVIDVEFSLADSIALRSRLTDQQVKTLSSELEERVARRHRR